MNKTLNILCAVILVAVMAPSVASAAECNSTTNFPNLPNQTAIDYGVCGYVSKLSTTNWRPAHPYHVAICLDVAGQPPADANGCRQGMTAYDGPNSGLYGSADYDVFFFDHAWDSTGGSGRTYYIFASATS